MVTMLRHTLIIGLLALGASSGAQGQVADTSGTFILHFFAQPAGKETYRLSRTASGLQVKSHFEYSDRGAAVPMDFTLDCDSQWRPLGLTITGKSTRFSDLQETITVRSRNVTVDRNKTVSSHTAPKLFFLGDENAHGAVQESLLRYWNLHGRPSSIRVFPAGDVKIQSRGRVVVRVGQREVPLNAYTLSGLIWGQESIWTDQQQHVAAIVEPDLFEIVREEYESSLGWFIENAVVNNLKALSRLTAEASQPARRKIAIVGGVLIDGTGRPPIRDAVVLTENDRITAVGTRSEVAIPKDAFVIPAEGKTILPGLWDMHAHYGQVEFGPIYLANGVTTVRDLGNEIEFIPAVRDAINAGTGIGPHILIRRPGRWPRTPNAGRDRCRFDRRSSRRS